MPNNTFTVIISAVDRATKTVAQVNRSFATLTRPVVQVRHSINAFAREAGLDRIGKGIVGVGTAAGDAARKIGGVIAPLAAVTGVGSIAGVTALAYGWARLGIEVSQAAARIGISTQSLSALQGAARLAGVDAAALTGGLKSLGDTLQDATYGRNQDALVMLNRLGISIRRLRDGSVDTEKAFGDLADRISKIKSPQVQALVARTFGLEEALPLLREGRKGIEEYRRAAIASGAVLSGPAAAMFQAFHKSIALGELAVDGLKIAIGERLIPILQPLIEDVTRWIAANRELIAVKVAEFATGVANAVRAIDWAGVVQGAKAVVAGVSDFVEFIGGWKVALIGVAAVMAGPVVLAIGAIATAVLSLGAVMIANPIGAGIALAVVAVVAAAALIITHWTEIGDFFDGLWKKVVGVFDWAWAKIKPIIDAVQAGARFLGGLMGDTGREDARIARQGAQRERFEGGPAVGERERRIAARAGTVPSALPPVVPLPAAAGLLPAPSAGGSDVNIVVDFQNMPRGVVPRVTQSGPARVDLRIGNAMPAGAMP